MSISTDFAKRSDKSQSFTDYKKTWVDPSQVSSGKTDKNITYPTVKTPKEPNKPRDLSTERVNNVQVGATRQTSDGRTQTYTGTYWRTGAAQEDRPAVDLQKVKEVSAERGEAAAIKQGQVKQPGEVYDPYAALQGRAYEGRKGVARPFIEAGKATAIRNKYMEGAGDQPQPTPAPEGGWESEEQRLQAQVSDQKALSAWWQKVGEASVSDISDVVSLTQDQMAQTQGYQEQVDKLLENLNQSNPPIGQAMSEVIKGTNNENLTPDVLSKLQTLAEGSTDPDEFRTAANKIISGQNLSVSLQVTGATDTGDGYDLGNGVLFTKTPEGGANFDISALPQDASAADLMLMENIMSKQMAGTALEQELKQLVNYSKSVIRAQKTAREEIDFTFGDARSKVDLAKMTAMNSAKYEKMKMEIQRDRSLENILEQEAQMEGYLKAQMESWGASSSIAALTVLQKNKLKFTKQYAETELDYSVELMRVNDKMTEAQITFTNSAIELAHKEQTANQKMDDSYLDSLDKIMTGTSAAYANRDMKELSANKEYLGGLRALNAAQTEAEQKYFEDTRDFNFDLMKEEVDASGWQFEMTDNGGYQLKLGADGQPMRTLAGLRADRLNAPKVSRG